MDPKATHISHDTIQTIVGILSKLERCGGAVNDDSIWASAGGCVVTQEEAKHLQSLGLLQASLHNAMTELKRFEAVTDALHDLYGAFEEKLKDLKSKIRPSLLSFGIQSLPNEILAKIFKIYVEEHDWEYYKGVGVLPEMTLAQVSTRFRSLAFSTPSVWGYISSTMSKTTLDQHLELSKTAPLTVVISEPEWSERLHHFIQLAIPHSSRWKSFTFIDESDRGRSPNFPAKLTEHFRDLKELPSLESFALKNCEDYRSRGDSMEIFDFFSSWNVPSLRHISTVSPCHFDSFQLEALESFDFHWRYGSCDLKVLVGLLASMPNLQKLCFDVYGEPPDEIRSNSRPALLVLPNLTDLTFDTRHFSVISTITSQLNERMPSLRKLRLNIDESKRFETYQEPLTYMGWLEGIHMQVFTNVKELEISFKSILYDDEKLELSWLLESCPKLETLTLDGLKGCVLSSLEDMPPLRSLSIQLSPTMDRDILRDIVKALKSHGLWEDFESFHLMGEKLLTERKAKTLTEGKLKWYE